MSGWQVSTLGEVADFILGKMLDQAKNKGELRPYLANVNVRWGAFDFNGLREMRFEPREVVRYSLRYGDILMCEGGEPGRCAIWKIRDSGLMFQKALHRIRPHDCLDSSFLYYSFLNLRKSDGFAGYFTGATIKHLPREQLAKVEICFPEISTQQKIAAILSAYDDLIANNQRRITLLERMAEDIYREWFVRLRFPGHESAKIEKGVPQGWKPLRFGQFCVLKRGYDLPDADIEPGPYPVIASTSIKAHHKTFKVLPPVITTGRSGSLGDVLYTNAKAWPLNTALYVKDFCGNSPFLVFYTLKNMGLENFNAGAGVPSLNRNHLNGIPIAVPSAVLQAAFDAKLSPIFQLKEKLFKQTETLKATRDALLPRLISGKLSVDALDIHFSPGMQQQGM